MAMAKRKVTNSVPGPWVYVSGPSTPKKKKKVKTPTQSERNKKIAMAISKRAGVMCILCDEFIYGDWGSKESKDIDAIIEHFDSKHEVEAAIVALSQDLDSIKDIIKKAKSEKAEQAYTNALGYKFSEGRVYHLKNRYDGWKCGYYSYSYSSRKNTTKRWGDIELKDRCKNCHRNSVGAK